MTRNKGVIDYVSTSIGRAPFDGLKKKYIAEAMNIYLLDISDSPEALAGYEARTGSELVDVY